MPDGSTPGTSTLVKKTSKFETASSNVVQQARLMDSAGTAWHAVKQGNFEMITRLFPNQCDVYQRGPVGENVMHIAMLLSTPSTLAIARYLVKLYGRSLVNAPYQERNAPEDPIGQYEGETALHIAIVNKDFDMIKFLVSSGADIRCRAFGSFFAPGGPVHYGEYPLSFAASIGLKTIVSYLKRHGAQVNEDRDTQGNTALHMCVIHNQAEMYEHLVEYCGASENVVNGDGLTPFVLAASLGRLELFQTIYNWRRKVQWAYGPVVSYQLALDEIDTVNDDTRFKPSAVDMAMLRGHTAFVDDPLVEMVMTTKWAAFGQASFLLEGAQYLALVVCLTVLLTLHCSRSRFDSDSRTALEVVCVLLALLNLCVLLYDHIIRIRSYVYRIKQQVSSSVIPGLYQFPEIEGKYQPVSDRASPLSGRATAEARLPHSNASSVAGDAPDEAAFDWHPAAFRPVCADEEHFGGGSLDQRVLTARSVAWTCWGEECPSGPRGGRDEAGASCSAPLVGFLRGGCAPGQTSQQLGGGSSRAGVTSRPVGEAAEPPGPSLEVDLMIKQATGDVLASALSMLGDSAAQGASSQAAPANSGLGEVADIVSVGLHPSSSLRPHMFHTGSTAFKTSLNQRNSNNTEVKEDDRDSNSAPSPAQQKRTRARQRSGVATDSIIGKHSLKLRQDDSLDQPSAAPAIVVHRSVSRQDLLWALLSEHRQLLISAWQEPWAWLRVLFLLLVVTHFLVWAIAYSAGRDTPNEATATSDDILIASTALSGWLSMLYYARGSKGLGPLAVQLSLVAGATLHMTIVAATFIVGFAAAFYALLLGTRVVVHEAEAPDNGDIHSAQTALSELLRFLWGQASHDTFMSGESGFTLAVAVLLYVSFAVVGVALLANMLTAVTIHAFKSHAEAAEARWRLQKAQLTLQLEQRLPRCLRQKWRIGDVSWDPVKEKRVYNHVYEEITKEAGPPEMKS